MKTVNIKKIREKRATVTFDYDGDPIELTYNRAVLTPKYAREVRENEGENELDQSVAMLQRVLVDWNLVNGDGRSKVPVTREELDDLDREFILKAITAIFEHIRPPQPSETPSEGSF